MFWFGFAGGLYDSDTGHVRCWGENNNGRLGTGETSGMEAAPADVIGFGD